MPPAAVRGSARRSPARAPDRAPAPSIHVSRLREVLPAGALVTRPPGYAVEIAPDALDLVRFDRLREQGRAALARGSAAEAAQRLRDALALWRGPALAEFDEPFAAIEAGRLEELRLACLEDRVDADLALGGHATLIGELAALVAHHPLREPSPALRGLERRMLQQDPALELAAFQPRSHPNPHLAGQRRARWTSRRGACASTPRGR